MDITDDNLRQNIADVLEYVDILEARNLELLQALKNVFEVCLDALSDGNDALKQQLTGQLKNCNEEIEILHRKKPSNGK